MTENAVGKIVAEVVELLTPLSSEERVRVATATFAILGENTSIKPDSSEAENEHSNLTLSKKGKLWVKQNQISSAQLSEVFHFEDGSAEIIVGEMPGTTIKDQVRNAYILLGLSNLLATDSAIVDDKVGRALCEKFGIYDPTNHSKAFKSGNELTGSSKDGWTVTIPGLRHAASLVKEASDTND